MTLVVPRLRFAAAFGFTLGWAVIPRLMQDNHHFWGFHIYI